MENREEIEKDKKAYDEGKQAFQKTIEEGE